MEFMAPQQFSQDLVQEVVYESRGHEVSVRTGILKAFTYRVVNEIVKNYYSDTR